VKKKDQSYSDHRNSLLVGETDIQGGYIVKTFLLIVVGFLGLVSPVYGADTAWTIDPAHSTIGFSVRHLGITNVHGTFHEFAANVRADPTSGRVTALDATAKAASVDTGIDKRDEHLRSDDFFNAAKYPTLAVKLKSLQWNGNQLTGVADLTIRDTTKSVPFSGELLGVQKVNFGTGNQLRAGYQLTAKINRQEFGLKFNGLAEGVKMVSDEVTILIEAEIFRPL
jgi:polyisoprenoid-binding protein YceI